MDQLKFVVLDDEDLAVVSTHLQDAVLKVSDVLWRPQEKRLVLALNRFDWESAQADNPQYRRRRAALGISTCPPVTATRFRGNPKSSSRLLTPEADSPPRLPRGCFSPS